MNNHTKKSAFTLTIQFQDNTTTQFHTTRSEGNGTLDQWLLTFRQALIENGLVEDSLASVITPPHE